MVYNILIAAILVVAFFMCVKAYCLGLKHGKQLVNNEVPKLEPIKEAVQHYQEVREEKEMKKAVENMVENYWSD